MTYKSTVSGEPAGVVPLRGARFLVAAADPSQWPCDDGAEVAFAGRSNVGKSSAINAITGHSALARTSRTPGRTRQIVFFGLTHTTRLVDLPGYGFARVPDSVRKQWKSHIEAYVTGRRSLRALVLAIDARRLLTPLDEQMLAWSGHVGVPVHLLLTKFDKLSRSRGATALNNLRAVLGPRSTVTCQAFSAVTGAGLDEARDHIVQFLNTG